MTRRATGSSRSSATSTPGPTPIAIFDETSDVKKGDKTPGVQRQWCGAVGKKENCIVTVHLAYARDGFHCLLDGELFLPESPGPTTATAAARPASPTTWSTGPSGRSPWSCTTAPTGNGLHFDWMTFDEGYGGKPEFLRELSARDQRFVGEVPRNFMGWIKPPRVVTRPYHKNGRGRGRKIAPPGQRQPAGAPGRRDARTTTAFATSPGSGGGSRTGTRGRWSGRSSTCGSTPWARTACRASRCT